LRRKGVNRLILPRLGTPTCSASLFNQRRREFL